MFFSTELLSKRDGGFGLLWLAATLGPKSSFNKLPKRSVLNADISELCDLIAQPKEPLSLRLSSNLMVGAARVFRVKHEIFVADVTSCFSSLKKAVQDMRAAASTAALEMNNAVARPEALNVSEDPGMGRAALEIDFLAPTWDDWISRAVDDLTLEELDEYDPNKRKSKGKTAAKAPAARSTVKAADVGAHTLDEPQLHLLSNASIDQLDSSSQPNASFNLAFDSNRDDDALFNFGGEDGIGLGNTELDLGLDLGEGWEYPTQATIAEESGPRLDDMAQMDLDFPAMNGGMGDVVEIGMPMDVDIPDVLDGSVPASRRTNAGGGGPRGLKRVHPDDADKEFDPANLGTATPRSILITPSRFGSALPDQHAEGEALQPVPAPRKPAKKVRLLLDERIELTDAEMKRARELYVEEQNRIRQAELAKKNEKDAIRRIDELMWAPPDTFRAPELLEFWHATFKVQVETRSGAMYLDRTEEVPPKSKRRRIEEQDLAVEFPPFDGGDFMMMEDYGGMDVRIDADPARSSLGIRASATPEVARQGSRPPSITGSGLGLDVELPRSGDSTHRKREPFPWDDAPGFPSSSIQGANPGSAGPRTPSVEDAAIGRLSFARSPSRPFLINKSPLSRESLNELQGLGAGDSSGLGLDDFQLDLNGGLDVDAGGLTQSQSQSQSQNQTASQTLASLERNSFNFLDYAKMQFNSRARATSSMEFEELMVQGSSTSHAAAAFYHCLLLATKNLISVSQRDDTHREIRDPITFTIL